MRIIVLFNLKPGIAAADYESWAKARDIPGVRSLPSIDEFTVHRTTGLLGSDGKPPFDYVEILDVADMEGFWTDIATEASTTVAKEFRSWLAAPPPSFLRSMRAGAASSRRAVPTASSARSRTSSPSACRRTRGSC